MKNLFLYGVLCVLFIAIIYPPAFTWVINYIVPLLSIVMLGMGITLKLSDFKRIVAAPRLIFLGVMAQYIVMPMLAIAIVKLLSIPQNLALGFVLVGTCPGGTSSNVMTFISRGDVALSVSITACSTLLAPLLTPTLTLLLAGKFLSINVYSMFLSISKIVIIPIILGMLLANILGSNRDRIIKLAPKISMIIISLIIGGVVSVNADKITTLAPIIFVAVVLHNTLGMALGYMIGKLFKLDISCCKTLSFEVGLQNSGLATSLAKLHFCLIPQAMLPGAIFSVWHNISGVILANYWSKKYSS